MKTTLPMGVNPLTIYPRKPKVLVSACLLGQLVRYDGNHKHQPAIEEYLKPWLDIEGHCPEVAAELGIPRPPIQLIQISDDLRLRQVDAPHIDVTSALQQANQRWRADQRRTPVAAILKARSPSCGVGSTPIHNSSGDIIATGSGIFAQYLQDQLPQLPSFDENAIASIEQCQRFVIGCYIQQALNTETPVKEKLKQQLGWDDHSGLRGFIKN
jgi:uncharacterized protein YbbK (DUF523 family)